MDVCYSEGIVYASLYLIFFILYVTQDLWRKPSESIDSIVRKINNNKISSTMDIVIEREAEVCTEKIKFMWVRFFNDEAGEKTLVEALEIFFI
jgi:hypothetical protein